MNYVYGIISTTEIPQLMNSAPGNWLEQAADQWGISLVQYGELAAVVREVDKAAVEINEQAILHHEAVIEFALEQQTVLPVRFGTVLPNVQAVEEALKRYYSRLEILLRELAGKVEMGIRVLAPGRTTNEESKPTIEPGETPSAQSALPPGKLSGREFLLQKYQDHLRSKQVQLADQDVLEKVHSVVSPLSVKWQLNKNPSPALLLSAVYLVNNGNIGDFQEKCRILMEQHPEYKILFSGPWPPYNFSGLR